MKKNRENKPADQIKSYGGFKYQFSYDEFISSSSRDDKKKKKRGVRIYVLSVTIVSVISFAFLIGVIAYNNAFGENEGEDSGPAGIITPIVRHSDDISGEESINYGDFSAFPLSAQTSDLYHLPRGVVVTYANTSTSSFPSGEAVKEGDIIMSVDGDDTPNTDELARALVDNYDGRSVILEVFRSGKRVFVEYDPKE